MRTRDSRAAQRIALCALAAAVALPGLASSATAGGPTAVGGARAAAAGAPPTPARYTALTPSRVLDTRSGLGAQGSVGPGAVLDLPLAGREIPADATAVVLTVTAVGASAQTDVRAYPAAAGTDEVPLISNLNTGPGDPPVAALVTVRVGDQGQVRLRNQAGRVQLVADLAGFYGPDGGDAYVPREPARLLDTRVAGQPLQAGEARELDLSVTPNGTPAVPADATAVVVNLTAVGASRTTDVRAWAGGATQPEVSNLNTARDRGAVADLAVVPVGRAADGSPAIVLRSAAGRVHLVVDLLGFFRPGADGLGYLPLAPRRLLDTRDGGKPAGPGQQVPLRLRAQGGVPWLAQAAVLTVTATAPTAATDVRVYPERSHPATGLAPPPTVSTLNTVPGRTVANATTAPLDRDGVLRLRSSAGSLGLVTDLSGVFVPLAAGVAVGATDCGRNVPVSAGFLVVEVDAGRPFTTNPCLRKQLAAGGQPFRWSFDEPAVVLTAANPGPSDPHWPAGECSGSAVEACAYDYGRAAARYAVGTGPKTQADMRATDVAGLMVWVDVDTARPWTGSTTQNLAVLRGMSDQLRDSEQAYAVGYRSTAANWQAILADTLVAGAQAWDPQESACLTGPSFTGGQQVLAQVSDGDVRRLSAC